MPRHDGVFVPHSHCTVTSGDCFTQGRCLSACTARKKRDTEKRLDKLEQRVLELERLVYPALHPKRADRQKGEQNHV